MTIPLLQRLETLYGLERHKDKLGLDGTRALLGALGDPHTHFRSVHVAGTNGKGSTCALIERVLREAGYRTGLFTSPHLVDFRERIRVGGRWVDEAWLDTQLTRIEALSESRDRTFFEVCTALAFSYFAERQVELAVVEVGLGGRLDCTNVITPEVSVITSIGLDHTEILGETIEAIAAEKAGIIKPGVPVVASASAEALDGIAATARERAAPFEVIRDLPGPAGPTPGPRVAITKSWGRLELAPSPGLHPARNLPCALGALERLHASGWSIPAEAVRAGVEKARWPGRLERCPSEPRLWWDGAHNAQGAEVLAGAWRESRLPPASAVVLAVSRDKDLSGVLEPLRTIVPDGRLHATRAKSGRALPPETLAATASARGWRVAVFDDLAAACRAALARGGRAPVLLCGSLFAIGEAMEAFGGAPGEQL